MNSVDKILLGKTNLLISRVVYGGIVSTNEKQEDSNNYVSYAIDRGINYFDVAPAYGDAEDKLGQSLIPYRKNIILACKTAERTKDLAIKQIANSFEKLHTDYFDVFQLHALTTFDDLEQAFSGNGVMNYLDKAKKEGIIRNIGFSAHNEEVALKALTMYDFDTVLYPINWALGNGKSMGKDLSKEALKRNMGLLALKSLALRHWKENEEKSFPKCWYKPIPVSFNMIEKETPQEGDLSNYKSNGSSNEYSDNDFAKIALKYTLAQGVHTIVPPGYFSYMKFVLDNIGECISNPLTENDQKIIEHEIQNIKSELIF